MARHDQAALVAEIARTQPYTFTDETPKESTLQGDPVYKLPVRLDVDKLVALNRLAAKRLGVPMPSWKYAAP